MRNWNRGTVRLVGVSLLVLNNSLSAG